MNVTMEEAQKALPDLIAGLQPGDRLVITSGTRPVAHLLRLSDTQQPAAQFDEFAAGEPQFGRCRSKLSVLSEDEEHLQDFAAYMP